MGVTGYNHLFMHLLLFFAGFILAWLYWASLRWQALRGVRRQDGIISFVRMAAFGAMLSGLALQWPQHQAFSLLLVLLGFFSYKCMVVFRYFIVLLLPQRPS
jgi:hypothetical protein